MELSGSWAQLVLTLVLGVLHCLTSLGVQFLLNIYHSQTIEKLTCPKLGIV